MPQATRIQKIVKFGRVVFELWERTNTLVTIHNTISSLISDRERASSWRAAGCAVGAVDTSLRTATRRSSADDYAVVMVAGQTSTPVQCGNSTAAQRPE